MQNKKWSWAEAITNSAIGFIVNVVVQVYIFKMFGLDVPLSSNVLVALLFFIIALGRSFMIRRLFNYLSLKTK